ncbi:MAG: tol-pal system-associated acyl-CoA thioesterase [Rhizobiales bacterium]|nr:tol-pal system-associated acyl-CoA thioesterase [Hyphomicrobiales bacterium]
MRAATGEIVDGRHRLALRVYYEDTDFSGVVYHASYLRFLERGRTEFLRALDIGQAAQFAAGADFAFVVRRMTIDWLKPARMDDELLVETTPTALGGAAMDIAQRVTRGEARLLEAQVTIACLAAGRIARIPAGIRARLAAALARAQA